MASGLPVVASAVPPLDAIIEDGRTGVLLPPDDEDAWLEALHRLILDPATLETMGEEARASSRRRFAAHRMVELYDELLRGLLA
jgi:phosphatidylinositol alpha-mannosyltransferase